MQRGDGLKLHAGASSRGAPVTGASRARARARRGHGVAHDAQVPRGNTARNARAHGGDWRERHVGSTARRLRRQEAGASRGGRHVGSTSCNSGSSSSTHHAGTAGSTRAPSSDRVHEEGDGGRRGGTSARPRGGGSGTSAPPPAPAAATAAAATPTAPAKPATPAAEGSPPAAIEARVRRRSPAAPTTTATTAPMSPGPSPPPHLRGGDLESRPRPRKSGPEHREARGLCLPQESTARHVELPHASNRELRQAPAPHHAPAHHRGLGQVVGSTRARAVLLVARGALAGGHHAGPRRPCERR
jgi:hypothetical protein